MVLNTLTFTHLQTHTRKHTQCKCNAVQFGKLIIPKQFLPSVYISSLFIVVQYILDLISPLDSSQDDICI